MQPDLIVNTELTTLAEIQRQCIRIKGVQGKIDLKEKDSFVEIPHPSENFSISTNGTYYIVTDNGVSSLYKIRK